MKSNTVRSNSIAAANNKSYKENYAEELMRLYDNGHSNVAGIEFGEFIEFLAKETRVEHLHVTYIFEDNSKIYWHRESDDYRLEQLYPCDQCRKMDCYCEQY